MSADSEADVVSVYPAVEGFLAKILVVDDDNDFRGVLREILRSEGFLVSEASDGISAVREFETNQPDAVILDHLMPRMPGIEALKEFKKINPQVPVVMMTASENITLAVEALRYGVYEFIKKPPEIPQVLLAIRNALELSKV